MRNVNLFFSQKPATTVKKLLSVFNVSLCVWVRNRGREWEKSQVKEDNKGYVAVALTNTEKYQPDLTLSSLISQWKLNTFLA